MDYTCRNLFHLDFYSIFHIKGNIYADYFFFVDRAFTMPGTMGAFGRLVIICMTVGFTLVNVNSVVSIGRLSTNFNILLSAVLLNRHVA